MPECSTTSATPWRRSGTARLEKKFLEQPGGHEAAAYRLVACSARRGFVRVFSLVDETSRRRGPGTGGGRRSPASGGPLALDHQDSGFSARIGDVLVPDLSDEDVRRPQAHALCAAVTLEVHVHCTA